MDESAQKEIKIKPFPLTVFINPSIRFQSRQTSTHQEGCLSVPNYHALVTRADRIKISANRIDGSEFSLDVDGWTARVIQHEMDHLTGTLFVDKMKSHSLYYLDNENDKK